MRLLLYVITLLIVCNVTYGNSSSNLQCKDENNLSVDWYVTHVITSHIMSTYYTSYFYKLPKIQTSSNPLIREGLAYLYITNATIGTGWQLSTTSIGSNNSIPGITLAPLYNGVNEEKNFWSLYNDNPPNASYAWSYGHTKGVVMANSDRGFWLIHSVPQFPPVSKAGVQTRPLNKENITIVGKYSYPESGTLYGQSFLCISLGSDQFNVVGTQLMYNEIAVYAKNIPDMFDKQYPVLRNATRQQHIKKPPYNHKTTIKSLGEVEFTSFAKTGKWGKDLYGDFVAPQLQSNLFVQSWLNGKGKLPTICSRIKIFNVKTLKFEIANVDYSSSHDHSKWAITTAKTTKHWVCVGDINRANTQFNRGGGAMCFKEARLWSNYRNIINDVESCHYV